MTVIASQIKKIVASSIKITPIELYTKKSALQVEIFALKVILDVETRFGRQKRLLK